MEEILNTLASLSSHFIGECLDAGRNHLNKETSKLDPNVNFVSTQLLLDCHLSSESTIILIREGKEWDADLINRSVMEGTIKYIYMMYLDDDDRKLKTNEFWEVLPNYKAILRAERARKFLSAVDNPDDPEWLPIKELTVEDEEITKIKNETNRKERKLLDQKWSFSEIIRQFERSKVKGLELLIHLAHGYGTSSHLIHKDGDSVAMIWERFHRTPEKYSAVKLAHSARVISDICTFSRLRLLFLLKACSEPINIINEIDEKYCQLFDELKKANDHFIKVEYELNNALNSQATPAGMPKSSPVS